MKTKTRVKKPEPKKPKKPAPRPAEPLVADCFVPVAKKPKAKRNSFKGVGKGRGKRRWYSDAERIALLLALKANAGDIPKTAREHDVQPDTLRCWSKGLRCPEALNLRDDYANQMSDALFEIAWQGIALMPEKMEAAPLHHVAATVSMVIEKGRLIRGEHTGFTRSQNDNRNTTLDLGKLSDEQRDVFLKLAALATGTAGPDAEGVTEGQRPLPGGPVPRALPRVLG